MHTRACTAGLRPKQTCSNISASAHLQSTKWCLRSNAQGSSADSAASLAVSKCSLIQNTCRSYDEPRSTSQNLCAEVLSRGNEGYVLSIRPHRKPAISKYQLGAFDSAILCASCDGKLGRFDDYAADFCGSFLDRQQPFSDLGFQVPNVDTDLLQKGIPVSYTHLRAHETRHDLVCRLLLEKKKK